MKYARFFISELTGANSWCRFVLLHHGRPYFSLKYKVHKVHKVTTLQTFNFTNF
jgi:hypothetical protein